VNSQPAGSSRAVSGLFARITAIDRQGRNFLLNVVEGSLFISTGGLASFQTVLPALIARMGGGNMAVGAIPVLAYVGVFLPQIFAARHVASLAWKKPWTLRYGFLQRLMLLLCGISVWVFGESHPWIGLILFFVLYGLTTVFGGIGTPSWFDLFAKLTPVRRRGRLVGIRSSLGGGLAMLSGTVLTWLLAWYAFPAGYALALMLASLIQFSSLAVQRRLNESEPSVVLQRKPMSVYLAELLHTLRTNIEFRRFIVACAFLILGTMPLGFFTVYALTTLRGDESLVGQVTLAMVASQMISAIVMGLVADRYGNKRSLQIVAAALLLSSIAALLAPAPGWFILVYLFVGIHAGSDVMTRYNMAIEYGTPEQRSTFVALMNTVLAPAYMSGLVAGVISETFGYKPLFVAGALAALIGLLLVRYRVTEPRTLPSPASSRS